MGRTRGPRDGAAPRVAIVRGHHCLGLRSRGGQGPPAPGAVEGLPDRSSGMGGQQGVSALDALLPLFKLLPVVKSA